MGARRIRREQRRFDQKLSRRVNGTRKEKERDRREKRMAEIIAKTPFPYTPAVMSYLSEKLGKPSSRIVETDVKQALAKK